jgi:hypothetical protein
MIEALSPNGETLERPLAGRKLYSPGVIAGYTALANLPMGCILYGLNLRQRGQRRLSLIMLWFGAISLVLLIFMSFKGAVPPFAFVVGIVAAINVYKLEKRPFERALQRGAIRARWWPPALLLVAALGLLVLAMVWIHPG